MFRHLRRRLLGSVEKELRASLETELETILHTKLESRLSQLDPVVLNIKNNGYLIGRALAEDLAGREAAEPPRHALGWRPSTQADIESGWFLWWCSELLAAPVAHRKLWEFAWLLQELHARDLLRPGVRALGFGCGEEPVASYLAARGVDVLITDLDPKASQGRGWSDTGQHTASIDSAFHDRLVDRQVFDRHVTHRFVDMNHIPGDLTGFDFCWSVCALEHLGSIDNGLRFVEESLRTLRSGGTALHTTEFNFLSNDATLETGGTVLFRRRDFEGLADGLRSQGCRIGPISFDIGDRPLDRFIDLPPYDPRAMPERCRHWFEGRSTAHLKLSLGSFSSTCFGMVAETPA